MATSKTNKIRTNGNLAIDLVGEEMGYLLARVIEPSNKFFKIKINNQYYYLDSDGQWETFPLVDGSGSYTVELYKSVGKSATIFSKNGKLKVSVKMLSDEMPFIIPNQYVNYNAGSPPVELSLILCEGKDKAESYKIVKDWIKKNIRYDYVRAVKVKINSVGYLPDIDYCFERRMGICLDIAGLAACMLRVNGIPAKLVIGYADKNYHSWVEVLIDGKWLRYDPTWVVMGSSAATKPKKYTKERVY